MYKLCKWIYELGFAHGKRAGREEVEQEYRAEAAMREMLDKVSHD